MYYHIYKSIWFGSENNWKTIYLKQFKYKLQTSSSNLQHKVIVLVPHTVFLFILGGFSGDDENYQSHQDSYMAPVALPNRYLDNHGIKQDLKHNIGPLSSQSQMMFAKSKPAKFLGLHFRKAPKDHSELSLLSRPDFDAHEEITPISSNHIVTMVSAHGNDLLDLRLTWRH